MKNTVKPFEGVGDISFGMERDKLRKIVKKKHIEVKRNEYAQNTSDYFEELGFFVEYSPENICEAIEYTDASNLFLNGQNLFMIKFSALKKQYENISSNIELEDEIGVTYHDLGFGVSCTFGTDCIESILVFSRDYWQL